VHSGTGLRVGERYPLPSCWSCSIWVRIEVGVKEIVVLVSMGSANASLLGLILQRKTRK
jgi:hypothetical protein